MLLIEELIFQKLEERIMSGQKKRKFDRIRFDRHVKLDFDSKGYDNCRIKNISLTGMFVSGAFQQKVDEHCLVTFFQKGTSSDLRFTAVSNVVWISDKGVALNFTTMSNDSYMFLRLTLINEAKEPSLMLLELPEECPFEIDEQNLSIPETKNS